MKKVVLLSVVILILGCASHKKTNKLASEINCDRSFYFAYDERSDFEDFQYEGLPTYGDSKFPDFKRSFIKSIDELDEDTEMSLQFVESNMLPSISSTFVRVRIEDIRIIAGISSGVLEVDLLYQMEGEKIYLTGKSKMHLAFTKKGSLYKALKNGHYLFISSICSR
ncbi:hypothetical protein [Muricauda sp. MAR_2010_75]|uniref:hypothetical protein n=1 Tax=Allomuricauda sp. MAR_2010_75 TaxID=1250232 RepID=UPI00055A77DF|nr:hypothetical protein [Muricauda sp. MAR_2010_75]